MAAMLWLIGVQVAFAIVIQGDRKPPWREQVKEAFLCLAFPWVLIAGFLLLLREETKKAPR